MTSSKNIVATIFILTALVLSGVSIPAASATKPPTSSAYIFPAASPTYAGSAGAFLSAPITTSPPYDPSPAPGAISGHGTPSLNDKPAVGSDPPTVPPTVNCATVGASGSGCSNIISNAGGASTNKFAMNSLGSTPFTVEPPDQALCVGNGFVMEALNQGEIQVYGTNLKNVSSVITLDSLMGLTGLGWSSGGDPMCQYDSANGGHWFVTEFVSASTEASGGPFSGCFAAVPDTCYEGIAVSVTNDPLGSYYVYFLNPNTVNNNSDPGQSQGVLLNDYTKTALTRDAFLLFYDEYDLLGPFNGAQEFAFQKSALESGSATVNVAYENMGTAPNLTPIPANGAFAPIALPGTFWYQVIPAQTTDPSQYDNHNGGTGFMVTSLDMFGLADNRVGVFAWTGLSDLNSAGCGSCGSVQFGGQLLTTNVVYQDEGAPCPAADYATVSTFCGLGAQKAGTIPLGVNCDLLGDGEPGNCPEAGIASNGDGATQAFMGHGQIWTAVSTVVSQTFNKGPSEFHLGATFWGVSTSGFDSGSNFTLAAAGYVSAAHEDMEFPAVAVASQSGAVLMSFTLSGDGGPTGANNGGFYPSSAYAFITGSGAGPIHITAMGQSPADGFTEYQFYGTSLSFLYRPRWGDYGQAVYDPGTGKFYFASEYIQYANCSPTAFLSDMTCGGTRVPAANWGSSINSI